MIKVNKPKYILLFLAAAIFLLLPPAVSAATLELVQRAQDIYQNESFIIDIVLDTESENVNAVELTLTFSPEILTVLDVSRGGSLVGLWIKDPSFSNTKGAISFIGGMPGGFIGEGTVGNITLLAKNTGTAELVFLDARVLLNDGAGTEALLVSQGKNLLIKEQIGSRTATRSLRHPNQNIWYSDTILHFQWDVETDTSYRYILAQGDPDAIPNSPESVPVGDVRFVDMGEGIFYFLLTQKQFNDEEFGPVSRYRVMIDNTPPKVFDPKTVSISGKQFLVFSTTDLVSGVDHYEVLKTQVEGAGVWQTAESPYLLEEAELRGIIKVKAVDKAGNEQVIELRRPLRFDLIDGLYLFLISIGLLLISWFWHKRNAR